MVRFVHTADWQLGMVRHFLSGEARSRFTQDRIDAIRRIGDLVRDRGAAFVVVAGDVFETNQVARQTVVRALEAMESVAVPLFLLPGNHDPLDAASVYRSRAFTERCPPNVVVLDSPEPRPVPGVPGVEVVGAPWRSKRPLEDLVTGAIAGLAAPPEGGLRVVVGHGAVDVLSPDRDDPARVALASVEHALGAGRVHYVALGDRHSATRVSEGGRVWYSGSPEATDFGEERSGCALSVDLDPGAPPSVEVHPVGRWRFVDQRFELSGAEDVDALVRFLDALPEKERTVVRLALTGSLPLAELARVEETLEAHRELFASLRTWERHSDLVALPSPNAAEALRLSGYARKAWDALTERSRASGDEGRAATDALALLHRLAGGGAP